MITRTPADNEKMCQAFQTLAKLTETDEEFYLLVAVIRMFHQVKAEFTERRQSPKLQLIKRKEES